MVSVSPFYSHLDKMTNIQETWWEQHVKKDLPSFVS
jgi:hypothetical protein